MEPKQPTIASKWNARYQWAQSQKPQASDVLLDNANQLQQFSHVNPAALDLACGRGANALWLAERGFVCHAWDISETAITQLEEQKAKLSRCVAARVHTKVCDVIENPPIANTFDVIIVSRFLHRPLCRAIGEALKVNGLLFYQTFISGLSNPEFLLEKDELPGLFPMLKTVHYQEVPAASNSRNPAAVMAHWVAKRPI